MTAFATETGGIFNAEGLSAVGTPTASFEAEHPALTIEAWVVDRLRACVADPRRVTSEPREPFQSRPGQRELPALNAFVNGESSSPLSKTDVLQRALELVVDVLAAGPSAARTARQIALGVEKILAAEEFEDPDVFGPLAPLSLFLTASEPTFISGGDEAFYSLRLTFAVTYTTEFGVPQNSP